MAFEDGETVIGGEVKDEAGDVFGGWISIHEIERFIELLENFGHRIVAAQ